MVETSETKQIVMKEQEWKQEFEEFPDGYQPVWERISLDDEPKEMTEED